MLRQLGSCPGSSNRSASATHHDGRVRTDDATGFDHWSTHSHHNQGRGPGRHAGAATNTKQPGSDAHRPCATG